MEPGSSSSDEEVVEGGGRDVVEGGRKTTWAVDCSTSSGGPSDSEHHCAAGRHSSATAQLLTDLADPGLQRWASRELEGPVHSAIIAGKDDAAAGTARHGDNFSTDVLCYELCHIVHRFDQGRAQRQSKAHTH